MQKKKCNYDENDTRTCKKCGNTYPIQNFPRAGIKNGIEYKRYACKKCYHTRKQDRRKVQRKWLNEYKNNLSCQKCGYSKKTHPNFAVSALQFHHAKDDKEFMISNGVSRGMSTEKLLNEIKKCIVLCCRCHAEIHKH